MHELLREFTSDDRFKRTTGGGFGPSSEQRKVLVHLRWNYLSPASAELRILFVEVHGRRYSYLFSFG